MASVSEKGWTTKTEGRCPALLIALRQRSYVLPWSLFLYAEGTDASVRVVFHTHVLLIEGSGLSELLADFGQQAISQIREPDRTAKFTPHAGAVITAMSLEENRS